MNVLYDITQLACGQQDPVMRTGIHRAVEELAVRLPFAPECDVQFSSDSFIFEHATQYLEAKPAIRQVRLTVHSAQPLQKQLSNAYSKQSHTGSTVILDKIWLKSLYASSEIVRGFSESSSAFRWSDIYHTPCYAIPLESRRFKRLHHFQTVYDLWPLLFPESSTELQIYFVGSIVNTLRPDDWVITDSQSAKDDLCNMRADIDPRRVFVTHLAADSAKFYPIKETSQLAKVRTRYKIPLDKPYLLTLCTLEPRKNLSHVVRSFSALLSAPGAPDICLVLAGGKGWMLDNILKEVSEASEEIRQRIILAGFIADEDLAALYSDALGFMFPSLYEGFGLPALEAMQCGTPVISSNSSSLPEVVGDAGILLDPKDQDGLCQAMLDLYSKPEMRDEMSRKSLERAGRFSWERCAQQTIQAYKTAMAAR